MRAARSRRAIVAGIVTVILGWIVLGFLSVSIGQPYPWWLVILTPIPVALAIGLGVNLQSKARP